MNIASKIRRSFFTEKKKLPNGNSSLNGSSSRKEEGKDELLGVTDELIDHVRSFTIDTFKDFSLDDEEEASVNPLEDEDNGVSSSANVKKDLSDWQERHAVLVLSKSKELSQLRFKLCPRLLKEEQFWRIYFQLVRNLVAKYEVLAIQQAKIRRMAMEETSETKVVYEVEMSETRPKLSNGLATP
ncbi:unnamed protein product [Microthlaspi erraticum]|uniref:BSD domain-containing protein n=1 Tax=Microthlaspi erraticum TaxID=1685480 RepID=A0A6D2K181_9BRAS|nr:unnamed protein product [Microthlaspi erraticum]